MNLVSLLTLLVVSNPVQEGSFDRFSFCRDERAGAYLRLCIELDHDGVGTFTLGIDDDTTESIPFAFSPGARRDFHELLEKTGYLEEADEYESGRNVANLGPKTMTVTGDWGRREAVYNYTTIRAASELTAFLERLMAQEVLRFETEVALQFDRLGIPDYLDRIEAEVRSRRIVDAGRLISVLDRIASDNRVVNYARSNAARLSEDLSTDFPGQFEELD